MKTQIELIFFSLQVTRTKKKCFLILAKHVVSYNANTQLNLLYQNHHKIITFENDIKAKCRNVQGKKKKTSFSKKSSSVCGRTAKVLPAWPPFFWVGGGVPESERSDREGLLLNPHQMQLWRWWDHVEDLRCCHCWCLHAFCCDLRTMRRRDF